MKPTPFIAVADRGQINFYQVAEAPGRGFNVRLTNTFKIQEAHQKYRERFTDQAGAFPNRAVDAPGTSIAERLPIEEETDKRIFRRLADYLTEYLRRHDYPAWAFSAPAQINNAILAEISPDIREKLRQNLSLDLVKIPENELLSYFVT